MTMLSLKAFRTRSKAVLMPRLGKAREFQYNEGKQQKPLLPCYHERGMLDYSDRSDVKELNCSVAAIVYICK